MGHDLSLARLVSLSLSAILCSIAITGFARSEEFPVQAPDRAHTTMAGIGLSQALRSIDAGPRTATLVFSPASFLSVTLDQTGMAVEWESAGLTESQELDVIVMVEDLGLGQAGEARLDDGSGVMRDIEALVGLNVVALSDVFVDDGLVDIQVVVDPIDVQGDVASILDFIMQFLPVFAGWDDLFVENPHTGVSNIDKVAECLDDPYGCAEDEKESFDQQTKQDTQDFFDDWKEQKKQAWEDFLEALEDLFTKDEKKEEDKDTPDSGEDDDEDEEDPQDEPDQIAPWTEGPMKLIEGEHGLFVVFTVDQLIAGAEYFQVSCQP